MFSGKGVPVKQIVNDCKNIEFENLIVILIFNFQTSNKCIVYYVDMFWRAGLFIHLESLCKIVRSPMFSRGQAEF